MRFRGVAVVVAGVAVLAGCTPNTIPSLSSPSAPAMVSSPTPTPIDGLPTDHTLSAVNAHTGAGTWAFIATTSGNPVAVRVNGLWKEDAGSLAHRNYSQPPSQPPVDLDAAVPYFLSWSYVVLGGTDDVAPDAIVLPSSTGNLYNVTSPFSDQDCPDYEPATTQGVGFLVTHCAVSLSPDGSQPIGLAFANPGADQQFWFLDAPDPVVKPS